VDFAIAKIYVDFFEELNKEKEATSTQIISKELIKANRRIGELEGVLKGLYRQFKYVFGKDIAENVLKILKNPYLIDDSLWDLLKKIEKDLEKSARSINITLT
jgi:hypothetical protein